MRQSILSRLWLLAFLAIPTLSFSQPDCPDFINYTLNDCHLVAEIASFVEGESVTWYFNDGTDPVIGGHFIEHDYLQSGAYQLCAFYTSPQCPNGVELCTQDIIVEGCNNPCELDVTVIPEDCNWYVLVAENYPENAILEWTVNGVLLENQGNDIAIEVGENEVIEVCAQYETPECPEGVFWCTSIEGEYCGNPCELDVTVDPGDCNWWVFNASNYPENAAIYWMVNGDVVQDNISTFTFQTNDIGVFDICAFYETPECPEGVFWCTAVENTGCGDECPEEIWFDTNGCYLVAEIGSFIEGESVTWYYGDGSVEEGGHFTDHTYEESGYYQLCAYYTSPLCPEGVELCTQDFYVGECGNPCELDIEVDAGDCNSWVFYPFNFPENAQLFWSVNGDYVQDNNQPFTFQPNAFGEYEVCAMYETPECPEGVFWCTTVVAQSCENDCPNEIWFDTNGCYLVAEIGSFVEGESVIWYYGDGTTEEGGHFTDHTYEESGYYQLCAYYTSPLCPEGVELCTQDFYVGECGNPCELDIEVDAGDCNSWVFYPFNFPENAQLFWSVNGDYVQDNNQPFTFQPNAFGEYEVCAMYETPECPEGVFWCTTVVAQSCENDCPEEIWYEIEGCQLIAEIGSFVEGESVIWYYGDGVVEEGGHFTDHTYSESGYYQLCAYYTSPLCPDGIELCTQDFYVGDCEGECTPISFAIDSFIEEDGPAAVSWELFNEEGTFNGSGVAQFSINDPFYDGEACLPDGCYTMVIESMDENAIFNEESIWSAIFVNGEQINYSWGPEYGDHTLTYQFGINSDCGEEDCYLEIEAIPQEDGSWYFEAFPSNPNATVIWNFGDGTDASGLYVPHIFENPGIYEVCAYFESDDCPEGVLQCVTVVVGDENDCTSVTLIISSLEQIEEDMTFEWALEGDGETQYGQFVLHAECQSTVLNLCLINGCFVFDLDLPGGEESVPLWITMLIDNQLEEEMFVEPGTDSIVIDFGVNTDCFNSVEEYQIESKVYPIPTSSDLTVQVSTTQKVNWTLRSISGAVVAQDQSVGGLFNISVGDFAPGMYLLELQYDGVMERQRIQIIR